MSSSSEKPGTRSTGGMFVSPETAAAADDAVQQKQAEEAKKQYEDEVDAFKRVMFGGERPEVPSYLRDERGFVPNNDYLELLDYLRKQNEGQEKMIRHLVSILRFVLLKADSVNGNSLRAAGMANAAWDCSQKHIDAYATRQMALHKCLYNLRETFGCFLDGEDLTRESVMEHVNVEAAAAEDHQDLTNDMEEAGERLMAQAREESEATGRPVRTAESFADDVTARTVRHHGAGIAARVTQEPDIQIAQPGTKLPKWSRKSRGGRH